MLGIDFGHKSVRIVEVVDGRVTNACKVDYPQNEHGEEAGDSNVAQALQRAVNSIKAAKKGAWGSIAGASVITHLTNYPGMEESELGGAVKLEAEQFVSRDWSEMDFDYQILDRTEEGGYRVLFVTAPKELSDKNITLFKKADVCPSGMTVDSLAIATAFLGGPEKAGQDAYQGVTDGAILVHIGAQITSIALLDKGKIVVLRDFTFGGNDITKKLMQEFNTDFEDAESIKKQGGDGIDTRVKDGVERAIRPLSQQISMTMGYERRKRHLDSSNVFLAGGGARAPGLAELIGSKFGADVEFMDPFSGLKVECELPPDNELKSDYTVAVGCALIGGRGE